MSEIRKFFTSRFPEGKILELDFSQLEIFALAFLSGDKQLKTDLLSGADLHAISAEKLFGKNFTKAHRKTAKMLSFQLQYGAGYKSMAKSNDTSEEIAKQFINNYYARYKGVKVFQDSMISKVNAARLPSERRTKTGQPSGVAKIQTDTGRIYTFHEHDAPDFIRNPRYGNKVGKSTSFSPTQIKNYPVQGFATADIVPMVVGKLYRALRRYEKQYPQLGTCLMINTVHDSVVFDCQHEMAAVSWANEARVVMETAPDMLKEAFGIEFDLPLKVEADIGDNWLEMETVKVWNEKTYWRGDAPTF